MVRAQKVSAEKKHEEPQDNIRAVSFVEVGAMDPKQIHALVREVSATYSNRGCTHYVVPVRNGKIGCDIIFEQEILDVVNKICEVKDGKIVLKGSARDVKIVRDFIPGD